MALLAIRLLSPTWEEFYCPTKVHCAHVRLVVFENASLLM